MIYLRPSLVNKKPKILPQIPPIIWAHWDILSSEKALVISLTKKSRKIKTKVKGICPARKFVNELSRINIKTIPLAPINPVEKKTIFRILVIKAVTRIIKTIENDPYFSSSMGPIKRINEKLPIRCIQSL
jgi:hypothetical protein